MTANVMAHEATSSTTSRFTMLVATAFVSLAMCAGTTAVRAEPAPPQDRGTMAFAITSWSIASYETKDGKEECPEGFNISNDELFLRSLGPEKRAKLTANGTIPTNDPRIRRQVANRGPGGEDVCYFPTVIQDPPQLLSQSKKSYGLDLDGAKNGKVPPDVCPHQEFKGLNGETGIDNQLYRLMACTIGWRSDGYVEGNANEELRAGLNAILIEVKGITDPRNSDNLQVTFKIARDPITKDSASNVLPYGSYRAIGNYAVPAKGKITNGVLTTEPVDAKFPLYANMIYFERLIRGMRLQLEIKPDGSAASGLIAGYYDFDSFWDYMRREGYLTPVGGFSCPAIYKAARQLADGYKDPTTGECTALSAAFKIDAIAAFVIDAPQKVSAR